MTTPAPSGATRPGRVAGVALLGVAAVALIIGLITLFGSNGDDQADGNGDGRPPGSSSQPRPPSSDTSTITNPPDATTTKPTSKPTTPGGSGAPTTSERPPQPPGDGNGEPAKSTPVRVYNNSMIKGLAARAADDLRADGWHVTEVGNYSAGTISETTVYYRPGTDEEAVARALAADFGMRVEPRFEGIQDAHPGVIVIVTDNYQGLNDKADS